MAREATKTVTETAKAVTETNENVTSNKHKFEQTDLILCRSVCQGEMLMASKTSGILYRWSAYGDEREVEYRDLYSLKASRSNYIYAPLFVIENEELLSDPRWKDVKELYNTMYDAEDLQNILALPNSEFENVLSRMPKSIKEAIAVEASTRIENGTLDSISKIKAINKVCGVELAVE